MRQRREKDMREKESGWERPSVAMETGSYQLTPCFPLVPHPPTPFPSPPSLFIFPSPQPYLPFFFFSPSLSPQLLFSNHTPLTFLPHTPASPPSISRFLHQPHPRFFPLHPLIPRSFYFHPLSLIFLYSPPFSYEFRAPPPQPPLLSFHGRSD